MKLFYLFLISLLFVSCGGGSGGSSGGSTSGINVGYFNATTVGASCSLAKQDGSSISITQQTGNNGVVAITLTDTSYRGVIIATCSGGNYIDEATDSPGVVAPTFKAALNYDGTQSSIVVSPISHIAYSVANNNSDLANISFYNTDIADELGLDGIDITTQIPNDLNNGVVEDSSAGKFGIVLAAISQISKTTGDSALNVVNSFITDFSGDLSIDDNANLNITDAINNLVNNGTSTAAANISSSTAAVNTVNTNKDDDSTDVLVSSISISGDSVVAKNGSTQLSFEVNTDASLKSVSWLSSDTNLATIDSSGLVSAKTQSGTVQITATANDGSGVNSSHSINIINSTPTANAGIDQNIASGDTVTLDGSASSDSDGNIASYSWTQTFGISVSLNSTTNQTVTFTAPTTDTATVLKFELTVVDNEGVSSSSDEVVINVASRNTSSPPTANAGVDQSNITPNTTVTLDGSASSDSDGNIASYSWTQTFGISVSLNSNTNQTATFTAPATTTASALVFELKVEDDQGLIDTDTIAVNVDAFVPVSGITIGTDNVTHHAGVRNGTSISYNTSNTVHFSNIVVSPENATNSSIVWSVMGDDISVNSVTGVVSSTRTNPTSTIGTLTATVTGGNTDGSDFVQHKILRIQDTHNGDGCYSCHGDGASSGGHSQNYDQ